MRLRHFLFLLLLLPLLAWAESDLVKKQSAHGVKETMDRLEALVKEKSMTVFARIDHRANAESVGQSMPDSQVLIFGNPKAGTRIMLHDLAAALDLPLRVLAYSDSDGNTWVLYHNPQGLKNSFGVEDSKVIGEVEGALDKITDQVVK
jgi:uncharacterized protein (DUF302 family)